MDSEELNSLLTTIKNQGDEITELQKEVEKLQAKVAKEAAKKTTAKKRTAAAAKEPVAKAATKKAATKPATEPKKTVGRAKKVAAKKEE